MAGEQQITLPRSVLARQSRMEEVGVQALMTQDRQAGEQELASVFQTTMTQLVEEEGTEDGDEAEEMEREGVEEGPGAALNAGRRGICRESAPMNPLEMEEEGEEEDQRPALNAGRRDTCQGNAQMKQQVTEVDEGEEVVPVPASNVARRDTCLANARMNLPEMAVGEVEEDLGLASSVERRVTCLGSAPMKPEIAEKEGEDVEEEGEEVDLREVADPASSVGKRATSRGSAPMRLMMRELRPIRGRRKMTGDQMMEGQEETLVDGELEGTVLDGGTEDQEKAMVAVSP